MHNQLLNLKRHRKLTLLAKSSHACIPEDFIGDNVPCTYAYDFQHIANSLTPIPPLNAQLLAENSDYIFELLIVLHDAGSYKLLIIYKIELCRCWYAIHGQKTC